MKTNLNKIDVSVVIPVFNEEENIKKLAHEINDALKNYKHGNNLCRRWKQR